MGFLTAETTFVENTALTTVWTLIAVLTTVTLGLFMWRRNSSEVIRARAPWGVFTQFTAQWIDQGASKVATLWDPQYSCQYGWTYPIFTYFYALTLISLIWRCIDYIARCETQRLRLAMKLQSEGFVEGAAQRGELTFFQRHLAFLTSKRLKVMLVLYCLWAPILRAIVPPTYSARCDAVDTVQLYMAVPPFIAFCALAFKIRHLDDAFLITNEFKNLGVIGIAYILLGGIVWSLVAPDAPNAPIVHVFLFFVLLGEWYFSLLRPLIMSTPQYHVSRRRQLTRGSDENVPAEVASLGALLSSKPGRIGFEQYLTQAFAIENLMFFDAITEFRAARPSANSPAAGAAGAGAAGSVALTVNGAPQKGGPLTTEEAKDRASALFYQFVAPGAPFEANLPYTIAEYLRSELGDPIRDAEAKRTNPFRHLNRSLSVLSDVATTMGATTTTTSTTTAPGAHQTERTVELSAPKVSPGRQNPSVARAATLSSDEKGGGGGGLGVIRTVNPAPVRTPSVRRAFPALSTSVPVISHHVSSTNTELSPTAAGGSSNRYMAAPLLATSPPSPSRSPLAASGGPVIRDAKFYLSIFDQAQREVWVLLESDAYARFVSTQLFAELVQSVRLAEQLQLTSGLDPRISNAAATVTGRSGAVTHSPTIASIAPTSPVPTINGSRGGGGPTTPGARPSVSAATATAAAAGPTADAVRAQTTPLQPQQTPLTLPRFS